MPTEPKNVKERLEIFKNNPRTVDFTKEWGNGHKVFNTAQANAMTELLHKEKSKQEVFDRVKHVMVKPRNPLTGDLTPRDVDGVRLLQPGKYFDRVVGGVPLLRPYSCPEDNSAEKFSSSLLLKKSLSKTLTSKLGVNDKRYEVLGNSDNKGIRASQPEDLFARTRQEAQHKAKVAEEFEKASLAQMKVKAKRHEQELEIQIKALNRQLQEKEKELQILRSAYNL